MTLRKRLNVISLIVVAVIVVITSLAYLATYNMFKEQGSDVAQIVQHLNTTIYSLITVSALTAIGGVLILRIMMHGIPHFIEELTNFTKTMIYGSPRTKLDIKGADEFNTLVANLNKLADSYKEKVLTLEGAMAKRQKAVRELAILNELMGFITSEIKLDIILKNLVERTKDLIKSDYCAAVIFEHESTRARVFVTCEGIQDPSSIHISSDGLFRQPVNDFAPLRINPQEDIIKIPDLNLEVKNVLVVPLTSSSNLSGLLLLANKLEGPYDQEDEDILMNFTFQAFQTIAMHEEITNLAVTDGLTGLNNHRNFQEKLRDESEKAKRYGRDLSLLIIDVDNFKSFNDLYGHQVGDTALKTIGSVITQQIRITDFTARYGGEEFTVIMPETSYNGARILAERLRKKVAATPFYLPNGEKALITVSIGFASIPENAKDKSDLINMADRALYFAKEHGRNLSFGFSETIPEVQKHIEGQEPHALENLANIIDSRSPYTKGHSSEVAKFATLLAQAVGLNDADIESIRIASMLHDVGTINVPERLLNKPGELTEEEKKIIRAHPGLAEMVLKKYPHIEHVLPIILYHHERYDGKGYPTGIQGNNIPMHARILAIAEAFHAMISPRPYKDKFTIKKAVEELKSEAGAQFDPQLVKSFIKILETLDYDNNE